ncbi:MAG: hypothetical protein ACXWUG_20745 [Polyangiales bacterium]
MRIFAFKADEDLAKLLDSLPNRSEFIRLAVLARFGLTCPTCNGSGQAVPAPGPRVARKPKGFGKK